MTSETRPDPVPQLSEEQMQENRKTWCEAYVHVWADLSQGHFDRAAIEKAADEHWQRSPSSNPALVAAMEYTKPH